MTRPVAVTMPAPVVAGSAVWYDGARSVLSLKIDPVSNDRLLECVKPTMAAPDGELA